VGRCCAVSDRVGDRDRRELRVRRRAPTLAAIVKNAGAGSLSVVVFATEYRCSPDTATGAFADLRSHRTGIARVGTARPKYVPEVRGCWSEDENNPNGFRVIPVRFTVWLAAPTKGNTARVMRRGSPEAPENARTFWRPVHKLFDGAECIAGLDLTLAPSAKFFNLKLERVLRTLSKTSVPDEFPFVITEGIRRDRGAFRLRARRRRAGLAAELVRPAIVNGKPLTYKVPPKSTDGFATYATPTPMRGRLEVHRLPALRARPDEGRRREFHRSHDETTWMAPSRLANYDALMYLDATAKAGSTSWCRSSRQTRSQGGCAPGLRSREARRFLPSTGQRETSQWAQSKAIPKSFRGDQLWGVPPEPLNETRLPANLQLPNSPFDAAEDTMTAVVGMGQGGLASSRRSSRTSAGLDAAG